jgi:hypothetical protein
VSSSSSSGGKVERVEAVPCALCPVPLGFPPSPCRWRLAADGRQQAETDTETGHTSSSISTIIHCQYKYTCLLLGHSLLATRSPPARCLPRCPSPWWARPCRNAAVPCQKQSTAPRPRLPQPHHSTSSPPDALALSLSLSLPLCALYQCSHHPLPEPLSQSPRAQQRSPLHPTSPQTPPRLLHHQPDPGVDDVTARCHPPSIRHPCSTPYLGCIDSYAP